MNRFVSKAVIVLAFVIAVGCGKNKETAEGGKSPTEDKKREKPAIPKEKEEPKAKAKETIAFSGADMELSKEVVADIEAAKKKYVGKLVEIEGTVQSADDNNTMTIPSVLLQGFRELPKPGPSFACTFSKDAFDRVNEMAPGQKVKIRGKVTNVGAVLTHVEKCDLLEISKRTVPDVTVAQLALELAPDNKAKNSEKYLEKTAIIEGTVAEVKTMDFTIKLSLRASDEAKASEFQVQAELPFGFSKEVKKRIEAVKKGDKVRVMGTILKIDEKVVSMSFCKLLK